MSQSDYTEYIARVSLGKDSLKMLDVIHTRGLPLDRITTTDVWATDTIPAWLPPMQAFRERMDQWIWERYRIELEHLCARNKDGSKKTYEQMFYHVPKRKNSQTVQVERERERDGLGPERFGDSRICGTLGVNQISRGIPSHRIQGNITGFPPSAIKYNWCQKLKHEWVQDTGIPSSDQPVVPENQNRLCQAPFPMSAPRGAGKEISWNIWELLQTSRTALIS